MAGAPFEVRLAELSQRIESSPDDPGLRLRRALVYADNQQAALALQDIAAAEDRSAGDQALLVRGIVRYRQREFDLAEQRLSAYLQRHADDIAALSYRARSRRDGGEVAAALADYRRLIRLDPERSPGDYLAAARLMRQLPEQGDDAAVALLDQRMAAAGPIPALQNLALQIERERCNLSAVIERLEQRDERTRGSAAWHLDMAEALQQAGHQQLASTHLSRAEIQLGDARPTVATHQLEHRLNALQDRRPGAEAPVNTCRRSDLDAEP